MQSFVVILIITIITFQGAHSHPLVIRDKEQPMETQIVDAAVAVPTMLSDGQTKAGQNPSTSAVSGPQSITGAMPAPIKAIIPGAASAAENSGVTPTLFIGGFSILMIPMSNGLGNMQQLMQNAPNMMNMIAPTG